jgi:spoIIIJ-associated protein
VEWVETTARSVEDAVDLALDQLGIDEQEAEWEVLEEPRPGLFGRVRGQARIRARIRPKAQPAKTERRDRRRGKTKANGGETRSSGRSDAVSTTAVDDSEQTAPVETASASDEEQAPRARRRRERPKDAERAGAPAREQDMEEQASAQEVAEQVETFLAGLVEAFGVSAPVEVEVSDEEVIGRVQAKVGLLIGPKGQTLEAVQELTRIAAQRTTPSDLRIKVDVGEYRAHRQEALEGFAREVAAKVRETGKAVALEPMTPPDRKIVHDALSDEDGVSTSSDGEEPRRRVVVAPVTN